MKKTTYTSIVWKEGKYFVAQCLNVEVSSFGKTKNEALKNLQEAIELYLEDRPARLIQVRSPAIVTRALTYG